MSTPLDTALAVLAALDRGDPDAAIQLLAEDVRFTFGNNPPTTGRAGFEAAAKGMFEAIESGKHNVTQRWQVDTDTAVVLADVDYKRRDGRELTLPACSVFRVRDGLVTDYQIYMDVNPVLAP